MLIILDIIFVIRNVIKKYNLIGFRMSKKQKIAANYIFYVFSKYICIDKSRQRGNILDI